MAIVFWDQQNVLLVDYMELGTATTADAYYGTSSILRRAIQNLVHDTLSEIFLITTMCAQIIFLAFFRRFSNFDETVLVTPLETKPHTK